MNQYMHTCMLLHSYSYILLVSVMVRKSINIIQMVIASSVENVIVEVVEKVILWEDVIGLEQDRAQCVSHHLY